MASLGTQILKATTSAFVIAVGSRQDSRDGCSKVGADLVVDPGGDVPAQLAAADSREIDRVLSTAAIAENLGWIAKAARLRPILTMRLDGLTVESMKLAHERIKKQSTVGKIVTTV